MCVVLFCANWELGTCASVRGALLGLGVEHISPSATKFPSSVLLVDLTEQCRTLIASLEKRISASAGLSWFMRR